MTEETKKFIELSDIVGLRLECRICGCSLLLDIEKEGGTINSLMSDSNFILAKCPTCGHVWTRDEFQRGAGLDSDIKEFFRRMKALKNTETKMGCLLSLEIKAAPKPSETKP